jgi:hypothetical protein
VGNDVLLELAKGFETNKSIESVTIDGNFFDASFLIEPLKGKPS